LFDLDPVICEKVCLLTPEDIANYVGNSVITDFGDALFALRRNLSDNYDKPTQGQLEYQEDMKAEGKRKQRRAEDPTILVCKDPMTLLKEVKFAASLTPGTEF
jgi:hypothetical protein